MGGMSGPTFSVIMPVYNHAAYVDGAIASVVAQTREDWELWIVNDGSTDDSATIADRWAWRDNRIHLIHQPNAGPAAARNEGFRRTRAPWLAFLDSDDLYYPDTLAAYGEFIDAHPDVSFFYGYRYRLTADGSVTELPPHFQQVVTGAAELFGSMYLSHLCVCYRRELFATVGGYDERLHNAEDYDLYLRLSRHTPFHPLGRATGLRRRHGCNISRRTGHNRMVQAAVLRRYFEQLGGRDVLDADFVARHLGKTYYAAGKQYFKERCFAQADAALRAAVGFRPTAKDVTLRLLALALRPVGRRNAGEPPQL